MICCTETSKQKIASTLLIAFSMVYVTAFLCDFEIFNVYDHVGQKEQVVGSTSHDHSGHTSHATTAAEDHHDSHTAAHAIQEEAHDHSSHDHGDGHGHGGADDDDCCTDDTNDIMNSCFSESIEIFDLHPIYLLCHAIPSIEMVNSHAVDIFNVNNIYYDLPPPDGGMHRRILIQSFLN